MKTTDYLSVSDSQLINWLINYKSKLSVHGATIGLTAAETTALQTKCDEITSRIQKVAQKKKELNQDVADKETFRKNNLAFIRNTNNRVKTHSGYTNAIGESLDIISKQNPFDHDLFKTALKAIVLHEGIRIEFIKEKTDGVNIYTRLKGQAQWSFLARDTRLPYIDNTPLATAGTSETREYMAYGVVDDNEIGQQSDIVSTVFGG